VTITDPGSALFAGLLIGAAATGIVAFVSFLMGLSSRNLIAFIASIACGLTGYFVLFAAPDPITAIQSVGSILSKGARGIWMFLYASGWLVGTIVITWISAKLS